MIDKVKTTDLKVGMYIDRIDASWFKHPFFLNHFLIRSEKEIKKLIDSKIESVYVDFEKSTHLSQSGDGQAKVPFGQEIDRSKALYEEARLQISQLMQDAKIGRQINSPQLYQLVNNIADSIFRNSQALLSLSRLKDYDQYLYNHSINVCILCLSIARELDLDPDEIMSLGTASLLHDIGLMKIPQHLLQESYSPTEQEVALIKRHPYYSADILREMEGITEETILAAQNHHEKYNGDGYPHGLSGKSIGTFGLIIRIADFYDHITSKWRSREAVLPFEAIKMILERSQTEFSALYAAKFVQCLGIYPIGTLVELNTHEIGVVVEINPQDVMRPRILLLTDSHCLPLKEKTLVNLIDPDQEIQQKEIIRPLNPKPLGIDPEEYVAQYRG